MNLLHTFFLCFVPLFVAVGAREKGRRPHPPRHRLRAGQVGPRQGSGSKGGENDRSARGPRHWCETHANSVSMLAERYQDFMYRFVETVLTEIGPRESCSENDRL